jgi:hypothetical protein
MIKYRSLVFFFLLALTLGSCEQALDLLSDDPRDTFVGTWSVNETTSKKSTLIFYEVNIEKSSSDTTTVLINNFYELGNNMSVRASVSGGNITISSQTVDGFTFQGSGDIAFNDKTIDLSYTVDYNNGTPADHVTATYTKK